jgi:hypothetical protein
VSGVTSHAQTKYQSFFAFGINPTTACVTASEIFDSFSRKPAATDVDEAEAVQDEKRPQRVDPSQDAEFWPDISLRNDSPRD